MKNHKNQITKITYKCYEKLVITMPVKDRAFVGTLLTCAMTDLVLSNGGKI